MPNINVKTLVTITKPIISAKIKRDDVGSVYYFALTEKTNRLYVFKTKNNTFTRQSDIFTWNKLYEKDLPGQLGTDNFKIIDFDVALVTSKKFVIFVLVQSVHHKIYGLAMIDSSTPEQWHTYSIPDVGTPKSMFSASTQTCNLNAPYYEIFIGYANNIGAGNIQYGTLKENDIENIKWDDWGNCYSNGIIDFGCTDKNRYLFAIRGDHNSRYGIYCWSPNTTPTNWSIWRSIGEPDDLNPLCALFSKGDTGNNMAIRGTVALPGPDGRVFVGAQRSENDYFYGWSDVKLSTVEANELFQQDGIGTFMTCYFSKKTRISEKKFKIRKINFVIKEESLKTYYVEYPVSPITVFNVDQYNGDALPRFEARLIAGNNISDKGELLVDFASFP